jgi:hypothetical protein
VNGSGQQIGSEALFDRYLSILRNQYNYDPGANPTDEFIKATNSNKYFVRGDFNLAANHQLTVRHNYIDALNDVGSASLTAFRTPDAFYRFISKTNSTVGQLNSTFAKGVNELRLTYSRIRDRRAHTGDQADFPQVTVTLSPGLTVVSGTDQFSPRNVLDQDIIELNDAYTMLKGRHTITIGSHNEFLKIRNLFIRDNFGTYNFDTLDRFQQGLAQQYDRSFSATSDPLQSAQFRVNQFGFYAGDQWRVRPDVTLTYGIRMDAPRYPTTPNANPAAVTNFGYSTEVVPENVQWSPRAGANWDVRGDGSEQIRGGVGMFTGRPAYVWISNQFGNTGLDFTRIGAPFNANNRIPFIPDPNRQPSTVTGATAGTFTNEIDVIDPEFKYPSILRGNLGWDRTLFWGFTGTAEFVWSNTLKDIRYQNLNFVRSGVTGSGGRPFFVRRNTAYSDVILLQNTDQGYNWNVSYEVRRPFTDRLFIDAAYSYGVAKTILDGTNDQAASGWGNVYVPGDPNDPPLSRSNYDPGHRINLSAAYDIPLGRGFSANVAAFYSGQSGRPYTLTTNRDVNGDNRGLNDLLYIPASASELTFTGGTYQDFSNFINADDCLAEYVGQIIPRNACRAPWQNTLDARVALQLPVRRFRAELTLDILNLINLVNSESGLSEYQGFGQLTTFTPVPATVTTTAPLTGYNIATITSPTFRKFLRDDLRSRWQAQLGVRVRF